MEELPILSIEGVSQVEGEYALFTVRLSEAATDEVTVDYNLRAGTALLGSGNDVYVTDRTRNDQSSGTLSFAAGELQKTVQVYVGSDQLDELDESFALELSNPTRASFGGSNQSLQALGWVLDDDGASVNRTLAVSSPTVVEGSGGRAVFTLSLSEAFTTDTTFTYATYNGSARSGADYVAKSGTVTFAAGQTEAAVTVNLVNDGSVEAGEHFGLKVVGRAGVPGAVGEAAILNDDGSRPILSIEGVSQVEGEYALFTVRLSEAATDEVTVDYNLRAGHGPAGQWQRRLCHRPHPQRPVLGHAELCGGRAAKDSAGVCGLRPA